MGKAKGKGTGFGSMCLYFVSWLCLAFIATSACASPLVYKGVKCDFNANAIQLSIGILDWIICLIVLLAVFAPAMVFGQMKWILIVLPYLLNFGFSVWGTVMLSMSKTCKKTASTGPKFLGVGDLYQAVDITVVTGWGLFACPFITLGLLMMMGISLTDQLRALEFYTDVQSRSDSYGQGV